MLHDTDRHQFDDTTADRVDLSNVIPIRADVAQDQQPAPVKKKRKVHPPAEARPHFKGKPQDSPYYIAPVTKLSFIEAMVEDDGLPPAALKAMIRVLHHYNHREGVARPGEDRIAEKIGTGRQTVSVSLNKAAERGWLQIIPTRIGNRNGPNHYVPVLSKAGLTFGKNGQSGDVSVGFSNDDRRVSPALNVGFCPASLSAKPDTNQEKEPNEVNPEREPGAPEVAVSLSGSAQQGWFDVFWDFYPNKVGKVETETLFRSIVGNDEALFVEIMDGAERYRNKEDDRPWFNPANWLKGARWNDQPAKVKPKAQARGNRPAI